LEKSDSWCSHHCTHRHCHRHRYSRFALEMAAREADPQRRRELQDIARICAWVPANPARDFREAVQSFWFTWLMVASGTTAGGRFDQFMYPFYQADKLAGRITDQEVVELLAHLRVRIMQSNGMRARPSRINGQAWPNGTIS
jgi:formate C-acetyltransferase